MNYTILFGILTIFIFADFVITIWIYRIGMLKAERRLHDKAEDYADQFVDMDYSDIVEFIKNINLTK